MDFGKEEVLTVSSYQQKQVTSKSFNFATKRDLPFFFVSASDGTNVVKVFNNALEAALERKENPPDDYYSQVMDLLEEDRV